MKKRIIAIVILVFVVAAGALLAWQYMKNRGGVEVRCDSTYPVNEKLKAYRQDDDRWKDDKLGESKFDIVRLYYYKYCHGDISERQCIGAR